MCASKPPKACTTAERKRIRRLYAPSAQKTVSETAIQKRGEDHMGKWQGAGAQAA
jgi:hypothetical protein